MEQDEPLSNNPEENLKIENELMRIKLQAQYGEAFQMESNEGLPPEIENQFLKNILQFEQEYVNMEFATVYERIGKPFFKPLAEMQPGEILSAIKNLHSRMEEHGIVLNFCDGPYPAATMYQFITEEFFNHEVSKTAVGGMTDNFMYEEFHPNHKVDIEKRAHEFLLGWFRRITDDISDVMSHECILPGGKIMGREEMIGKIKIFFDAFTDFANDGYNINDISFELQNEGLQGMGFAEGMLKYDAIMDNGEQIHYEGGYKLYMQLEENWWSVFHFIMPGFA